VPPALISLAVLEQLLSGCSNSTLLRSWKVLPASNLPSWLLGNMVVLVLIHDKYSKCINFGFCVTLVESLIAKLKKCQGHYLAVINKFDIWFKKVKSATENHTSMLPVCGLLLFPKFVFLGTPLLGFVKFFMHVHFLRFMSLCEDANRDTSNPRMHP
jgi:hypothetical protein